MWFFNFCQLLGMFESFHNKLKKKTRYSNLVFRWRGGYTNDWNIGVKVWTRMGKVDHRERRLNKWLALVMKWIQEWGKIKHSFKFPDEISKASTDRNGTVENRHWYEEKKIVPTRVGFWWIATLLSIKEWKNITSNSPQKEKLWGWICFCLRRGKTMPFVLESHNIGKRT